MSSGKPNAGDVEGARAAQRAATKADLLERKKPRSARVEVTLDDEVVAEYEDALAALEQCENGDRPAAEKRLKAAEKTLSEATVVCTFQAIGALAYDELVAAHPPTEEQLKEFEESRKKVADSLKPEERVFLNLNGLAHNPDTFPVALITASLVEPSLSEAEVRQLWDTWNAAERGPLFAAAVEVNTRRRVAEVGKGSASTRGSSKS